jgi:tetratricopeptide (TPR) repeat protein
VAQQIASELNAEMTKGERKRINKKPTENPLAYEYFIQASQLRDKLQQTQDTNYYINSELLFGKAITLDPEYALAHAGLAHLYNTYTLYIKEDSSLKESQVTEINKAYLLAPDDDYINSVKGAILRSTLNDPLEAFKSLIKAYQINPNNTNTLYELGIMLSDVGLYEERITLLEKVVKLDPLNSTCFGYLGGAEVHLNRLDKGIQYMQIALKLTPDMFYVMDRSAYVYALQDNLKEADNWLKRFFLTIPEHRKENFLKGYGQYSAYCSAKLGDKTKALEISNHWRVYLALGMKEEALQNMIKKETTRSNPFKNDYLIFKSHLPHKDFDIIRDDPRFIDLMEKKRIQYEINKKKFSVGSLVN